jgi:hypothetical protein
MILGNVIRNCSRQDSFHKILFLRLIENVDGGWRVLRRAAGWSWNWMKTQQDSAYIYYFSIVWRFYCIELRLVIMNIAHIKKYPLDGVKWAIRTACIVEAQPPALCITRVLHPAKLGFMRLCFQILLLFYCGYPFQHQILDDCSIDFVFLSEIFRSHSLCRWVKIKTNRVQILPA